MDKHENNSATCLVEGKFFEYDFENAEFPGKADMEAMDSISTFSEYVHNHAVRCGYMNDAANTGALASFVFEKCK